MDTVAPEPAIWIQNPCNESLERLQCMQPANFWSQLGCLPAGAPTSGVYNCAPTVRRGFMKSWNDFCLQIRIFWSCFSCPTPVPILCTSTWMTSELSLFEQTNLSFSGIFFFNGNVLLWTFTLTRSLLLGLIYRSFITNPDSVRYRHWSARAAAQSLAVANTPRRGSVRQYSEPTRVALLRVRRFVWSIGASSHPITKFI